MNQVKHIITTWSYSWGQKNSIGIETNLSDQYIRISYTSTGNGKIDYKVQITSIPSNLGKGVVYYFICPKSGKRCRKLYSSGKYFISRYAIKEGCYDNQRYSKKDRELCRVFDYIKNAENAEMKIVSKHFKKFYNGKPTKKYLKLLKVIKNGERYPPGTIDLLLLGISP